MTHKHISLLLFIGILFIFSTTPLVYGVTNYADNVIVPSGGNVGITGNLGIGTTSPTSKLQVTGGITVLQQTTWTTATTVNNWINYNGGTPFSRACYYKDSAGVVHLKGLVAGNGASTIFTLPAGYRPALRAIYAVHASGAIGRLDIDATGNVIFVSGTPSYVQLDGITFVAEQ